MRSLLVIAMTALTAETAELTPVPLAEVREEFRTLIEEAGGPLTGLAGMGDSTAAILTGDFKPLGHATLVLLDTDSPGLPGMVLFDFLDGSPYRTDFEATGGYLWRLWELRGVTADDLNDDGYTDISIVADYMTGIGPEGAVPFTMTSVLLWDPDSMSFRFDPDLSH